VRKELSSFLFALRRCNRNNEKHLRGCEVIWLAPIVAVIPVEAWLCRFGKTGIWAKSGSSISTSQVVSLLKKYNGYEKT